MYVDWKEFSARMDTDQSYRHYVKTFGFIVIKNFFSKTEFKEWKKEYDKAYLNHFKKSIHGLHRTAGQTLIPNFVDNSPFYAKAAFDERFQSMARYFCGKDFLYLGSDGSAFSKHSFRWHRDWYTITPVLKFNMYFNPPFLLGGNFLIVPGSHIPTDSYSNLLNKGLAWPFGETVAGGLNERSYFPHNISPRLNIFKSLYHRLIGRNFSMPYARIKVRRGDIVIFDQRAIHSVEPTFPRVIRRLCTLLFAEHPNSLPDKHYTMNPPKKWTREDMQKEITSLFWLERELIGVPPYGRYVDEHHPLYPDHLFTPDTQGVKEEGAPIDLTQYQTYADKMTDPAMKNVFYTSNMLGFALKNIRDIES